MSASRTAALPALACLAYALAALVSDAIGSIIPLAMADLGIGVQAAGALQYLPAAATAGMALLAIAGADRLGAGRTTLGGLLLFVAGAAGMQGHPLPVGAVMALMVVCGVGISLFKLGTLALLGRLHWPPRRHGSLMNAVEGCYALGSIAAPWLVTALAAAGWGWRALYMVGGSVGLVLLLGFLPYRERSSVPPLPAVVPAADAAQVASVLRQPLAWWFAGLLGVYVVVELTVCVWMPSYLLGLGATPAAAAWALTLFFALRAAGRFAGIAVLRRWRWPPLLAGCAVLALASLLAGSLGGLQLALWVLPASGLFLAVLYPTLNSHLLSRFPATRQASVAGLATFCSATGAALGSWTIATASEASGDLRSGLLIGTLLAAVLAAALSWQAWRRPPSLQLP